MPTENIIPRIFSLTKSIIDKTQTQTQLHLNIFDKWLKLNHGFW